MSVGSSKQRSVYGRTKGEVLTKMRDLAKREDPLGPEFRWVQAHERELQREYPGMWIAVEGESVVATAATDTAAVKRAWTAGATTPVLFYIAGPSEPIKIL